MKISQALQWILLCIVLILTGIYLFYNREVLNSLHNLTPRNIILLFLFVLSSSLFLGYQFRVLMRFFNIQLTTNEWFGLTICNTMYSYFLPTIGGMWLRAFYLKKRYDFLYSNYANLVMGSFLLMYGNACMLGMLTVSLNNWISNENHWNYFAIFPVLAVATFAGWRILSLLNRTNFKTRYERINQFLYNFRNGMNSFRRNPSLLGQFLIFNNGFIIFNGLSYGICLHAIGATDVAFIATIGIMALTSFSKLISLTPGNLGVQEMIMSLSCTYMGVPFDIALLAACINRAASIIIVFLFGIIYSKILMSSISGGKISENLTSPDNGQDNLLT